MSAVKRSNLKCAPCVPWGRRAVRSTMSLSRAEADSVPAFCPLHSGESAAQAAKRTAGPTLNSLQRELQLERERHRRSLESVEQLRLEMQMMARAFAAAREQIVALGGSSLCPEGHTLQTTAGRGRARSDVKAMQRIQSELSESKSREKRLQEQVSALKTKVSLIATVRKELITVSHELQEHLSQG